jgi:hypothetical protein
MCTCLVASPLTLLPFERNDIALAERVEFRCSHGVAFLENHDGPSPKTGHRYPSSRFPPHAR